MINKGVLLATVFFTLIAFRLKAEQYFQQRVSYDIQVVLNDKDHMLSGQISIRYTNNSPDTLRIIKMHLWPNAYSSRNTALCRQMIGNRDQSLFFAEKGEKGWIDSLKFMMNQRPLQLVSDPVHTDIADLILIEPLLPGQTITVTSPFQVKIPSSRFSRFGHRDQAYFITQWYPKPAVYDQNGWHPMPYLTNGEFYSEFGSFKVSVTLPFDYVVAGTGILKTESEIAFLDKLALQENGRDSSFVPDTIQTMKTIVFEQDSIHDFAWFANKNYRVAKKQVKLPSSKVIDGWVFYTDRKADLWKQSVHYIESGLQFFSEKIGEYPFSHFTVVDGQVAAGGGMEYPMITLINTPGDALQLETIIAHELCHNWFYGMLASNERKYAWMDEGFTSYYELLYKEREYPGDALIGKGMLGSQSGLSKLIGTEGATPYSDHQTIYQLASHRNLDQPINTSSEDFTNLNYGAVVYSKMVLALRMLNDYLGDPVFEQCIKAYFEEWKFRHPDPADIKTVFERVSERSLDWFFNGILNTVEPQGYCVTHAVPSGDGVLFKMKSNSNSQVPVKIANQAGETMWHEGFEGEKEITVPFKTREKLTLNGDYTTLLKGSDRFITTKGRKELPHLKFNLFYQAQDSFAEENIMILPVPAWNRYNKWMAGVHITNMDLIPEKFEFFLTPLFDFTNKEIAGIAQISYHHWPINGFFSGITFSGEAKRFAYDNNRIHHDSIPGSKPVFNYTKFTPSVEFEIRKPFRSTIKQTISLRNITIWQEEIAYTATSTGFSREFTTPAFNFSHLYYNLNNRRIIDPYSVSFSAEQSSQHVKLTGEFNYRFSYRKKNKGIDIRFFAGGFVVNNTTDRNYNLKLSSWKGRDDYLYDEYYFGRSDNNGLWDNQMVVRDGGFKIATGIGQTGNWLVAMNLLVDIPAPLPIKFYFDAGTFEAISTIIDGKSKSIAYNGGVALVLVKNVIEIYIPLFMSDDIKQNLNTNNIKFAEQIRFVFNIRGLAPSRLRNDLIDNI